MNSEDIKLVTELIEKKDSDQLKEVIKDLHPADIAELCNELDAEDARFIYLLLDNETAADVLIEMDEDARKKFLEILPPETIAKRFVDYMDSDDAVDIIREMDEDKQEEVLSHIEDIEQAGDIVDLLKYDEDTAGGLMGTEMVIVNENWSMPECLREMRLQAEEMDEIYYVYVVDDDERLRGVFPLKKMITSPSVSKVKHVMKKDPISVHVDTPIEEVVQTIEKYDLVAVPVVDSIGRLVGRITVDDVMDEVREQAERDYQLASGLSQDVETDDNVFRQTTARLPWLLIGMLGGIGNSMILGNFDSTFAAHPEMALYIPLIGGLVVAFLDMVENHKMIVENSGLLTVAALKQLNVKDKRIVSILSGGNMDVITMSSVVQQGLILRDRIFTVSVLLPDKPGELCRVSGIIAGVNGNVIKLEHNQFVSINRSAAVELRITLEAFGTEHKNEIIAALEKEGYQPKVVRANI